MREIIWATILVTGALLLHLLVWRIRLPKYQAKSLVYCFAVIFCIGLFANYFLHDGSSIFYLQSLDQYLAVTLFYFATMAAYIITYSAVEVDSPSLLVLLILQNEKVVTLKSIGEDLNDDVLLRPRVDDLVRDGLLMQKDNRYHLTEKGRGLGQLFVFFRSCLRAEKGG
jgi:predicted transcriptional regulator